MYDLRTVYGGGAVQLHPRYNRLCRAGRPLCIPGGGGGRTGAGRPGGSNFSASGWPRSYTLGDATLRVFQPQVKSWQDNLLDFRVAVDALTDGGKKQVYGVCFGNARTQVDRVNRVVTLADLTLTRSNFPTLADNGEAYRQALQQQLASSVTAISLDRLQASLAANGDVQPARVQVRNVPPEIIVSDSPAILVPIAGEPVIKAVADSDFQRVINTRTLVPLDLPGQRPLELCRQ